MKKSRWIVVANASQARVLQGDPVNDALVVVHVLSHPDSRAKGRALGSDRPGHEAADNSHGGNRYEPRTDVRRKEHRAFAREIAELLDDAWSRGVLESVAIAASAPFLGELKQELSGAVRQRLDATLDRDLTALDLRELTERLRELHADA